MTAYYGADYFSDAPAPSCPKPGMVLCKRFTVVIGAALASADTVTPVRMPANHRVLEFSAYSPDLDSSGNLTWDIGYTGTATGIADNATLGTAAGVQTFPGASTSTGTHLADAAAPTSDYDILMDPTVGGTGATGTISGYVLYTTDVLVKDNSDSPAVVAGTQ